MPTFYNQFFKSTDVGAPVLSGTAGALINLLNKCLVDGFTAQTVTQVSSKGSDNLIAVVQAASSDTTLYTGAYMTMAGFTPAGYNGTYAIRTVAAWAASFNYPRGALVTNGGNVYVCVVAGVSAGSGGPTGTGAGIVDGAAVWDYILTGGGLNLFTYLMPADPGGTPSSAGTYAKAPLQWTRPFAAGTNSQTYRSQDSSSDMYYLQVIDNAATSGVGREAQVFGAISMSADQVVVAERFPTTVQAANGWFCRKSNSADAVARAWSLWGDGRTFGLHIVTADNNPSQGMMFGHYFSNKPSDQYRTFLMATSASNPASGGNNGAAPPWCTGGVQNALLGNVSIPRSYTQLGTAINAGWAPFAMGAASWGPIGNNMSAPAYPGVVDSGLYIAPMVLLEATNVIRGRVPGLFSHWHGTNAPLTDYDESTGFEGFGSLRVIAIRLSQVLSNNSTGAVGMIYVDKLGPYV